MRECFNPKDLSRDILAVRSTKASSVSGSISKSKVSGNPQLESLSELVLDDFGNGGFGGSVFGHKLALVKKAQIKRHSGSVSLA